MIQSFRDLRVWQKGMDLAVAVYRVTEAFPKSETFGLTSQIRRASVSIPSNVAEGKAVGGQGYRRHIGANVQGHGSGSSKAAHDSAMTSKQPTLSR